MPVPCKNLQFCRQILWILPPLGGVSPIRLLGLYDGGSHNRIRFLTDPCHLRHRTCTVRPVPVFEYLVGLMIGPTPIIRHPH